MLKFYKYHGAGNDFILIDNRDKKFKTEDVENVKLLCHRRFGIGADGIILVEKDKGYDFKMVFINNDGSVGSMCGNGGRCIVHFANNVLKIVKNPKKVRFIAIDGEHEAEILKNELIKLKMQDVKEIGSRNKLPFVCQGTTPHNISFVKDLENFPVVEMGRKNRYSDPNGVNTNFVEIKNGIFNIRTYERGVEDETLACGTGAVSVAITAHHLGLLKKNICRIKMPGGNLTVEFEKDKNGTYKNIYLTGPAVCVFEGEI
ncbi:MAG: diaminopimelate epimerase [Candidatus Paceibacterota bacterium]|jgi:diaminopimelate epimerase